MSGAIHLVYGEDDFNVQTQAKKLIADFLPENERDFGLDVIDGNADVIDAAVEAIGRTIGSASTMPFMGGRKVTYLQNASFFSDGGPGKSDTVKQALERLSALIAATLPDTQMLVISAPKIDKRMAFYKACKVSIKEHAFEVPEKDYLAQQQIEEIFDQALVRHNIQMTGSARALFLDKVGNNTRTIFNELEKVSLHAGTGKTVTDADVEAVTCTARGASAWDLPDAIGSRDLPKALAVLGKLLAQKESGVGLIFQVESRVRDLLLYREALQRKWLKQSGYGNRTNYAWQVDAPEVDGALKAYFGKDPRATHPFRVGILAGQAALFSIAELKRALSKTLQAHKLLVSSRVPEGLILEILLIDILGPASSRKKVAF